jgi:hypothetical protein
MLLGNTIQSDIEELRFGVYLAVDVGNDHRKVFSDSYYLIHVVGEAPFLSISRIVSIPGLSEVKIDEHGRYPFDIRDLKIIRPICDLHGLLI